MSSNLLSNLSDRKSSRASSLIHDTPPAASLHMLPLDHALTTLPSSPPPPPPPPPLPPPLTFSPPPPTAAAATTAEAATARPYNHARRRAPAAAAATITAHNLPQHSPPGMAFSDSALARSAVAHALTSNELHHELDALQSDDLFVEDYLLSKLQDAQRRLQDLRDYRAALDARNNPSSSSAASAAAAAPRAERAPAADTLFVASCRLPLALGMAYDGQVKSTASTSSLGLVSAFKQLWARLPITWVGTPAQTVHDDHPDSPATPVPPPLDSSHAGTTLPKKAPGLLSYAPIFPDPAEAAGHQDFCDLVLWPLFHHISFNLGERSYYQADMFTSFVRVNRLYTQELIKQFEKSDINQADAIFWIHDFQLCLVPKMLRELLPNARIGFFLHIPFPTRELFRILAARKELLEGMLGADLLGFHTYDYAHNFVVTCERVLGLSTTLDSIDYRGVHVQVGVYPFGIDSETFLSALKQSSVMKLTAELKESLDGKKLVLGVDRLDYTKGIPNKLFAIEHFLETHPEWIGRVMFLQITTSSAHSSEESLSFRSEILEMVGRINGRFGTLEDMPIHYREVTMTFEELCALYQSAHVAMITSIRDGMNLVSYEYVVCQRDRNGVLILSEFAGAAKNLPGSVLVNPWDIEGLSDAIHRSLEMPNFERELRHRKLYRHVVKYSSAVWGETFINDLIKYSAQRSEKIKLLRELSPTDVCASYKTATGKRLFFLDYDGTLRRYESQPELALPTPATLKALKRLASNEQNIVFIVTGRQKEAVLEWFGGTSVGFAVEHGFSIRWPDHLRPKFGGKLPEEGKVTEEYKVREPNNEGERLDEGPFDNTWDDILKPDDLIAMRNALQVTGRFLEEVEGRISSSFLSEKESAYSWHFRDADASFVRKPALEAKHTLEEKLVGSPMEVLMGQGILYVRPRGVNKGAAVAEVLRRLGVRDESPSWILSVGDDRTDEDMFNEVHRLEETEAVVNTCTVGRKTTAAKFYAGGVDDVVSLLGKLADC